jgi:hypothetical protein
MALPTNHTYYSVEGWEHVKAADLPTLIDAHLSTGYPELADFFAPYTPAVPRPLTNNEKCFLQNYSRYRLKPADLFGPLSGAFPHSGEDVRLRPLYYEWAAPCLEQRPDEDVYLKRFNSKPISTLADFIKEFGKKP